MRLWAIEIIGLESLDMGTYGDILLQAQGNILKEVMVAVGSEV